MDLAERLRHALVELELSQAELARRTGISRGTVNKIVNAKREPNAAQLGLLAHELGLELDELLGEEQGDERELIEQQLRKAVLRIQRGERARSEQAVAAKRREAELEALLAATREALERERGKHEREREEMAIVLRDTQARAKIQALRLHESERALALLRRRVPAAQSAQDPPVPEEAPARKRGLGVKPREDARLGTGFTERVLSLALEPQRES